MARNVFFSFQYKHVWRVNQIRSIPNVTGVAAAGFKDESLWEKSKAKGHNTIKRMIDSALEGTSVTVVCITRGVITRDWINYEIEQSLKRNNGLLGLHLHTVYDRNNPDDRKGAVPPQIEANDFKVFIYNEDYLTLAQRIEEAARLAGR